MGKKRSGAREYILLPLAGMILLSFAGCATIRQMEARREAREHLITAQKLLAQGDYEGSLRENQKVMSSHETVPPGDEAIFNTGLIYADHGYPQRDHKRSLDSFRRLLKVFPESHLAGQAKIWIGILQENGRLKRDVEELNKTIKKLKQVDIEIDERKRGLFK